MRKPHVKIHKKVYDPWNIDDGSLISCQDNGRILNINTHETSVIEGRENKRQIHLKRKTLKFYLIHKQEIIHDRKMKENSDNNGSTCLWK